MKLYLLIIYILIVSPVIPDLNPGYSNPDFMHPKIIHEWLILNDAQQLDEIIVTSQTKPVIIYKHSTRCGVSSVTLKRLESGWDQLQSKADLYYLDLLRFRDVSDRIASLFNVRHESPQILIIHRGKVIYSASHYEITVEKILEHV